MVCTAEFIGAESTLKHLITLTSEKRKKKPSNEHRKDYTDFFLKLYGAPSDTLTTEHLSKSPVRSFFMTFKRSFYMVCKTSGRWFSMAHAIDFEVVMDETRVDLCMTTISISFEYCFMAIGQKYTHVSAAPANLVNSGRSSCLWTIRWNGIS